SGRLSLGSTMLNGFRSTTRCPVDPQAQQWIERRLTWLTEQFGWNRLRSMEMILPRPEFFPDPYSGSPEDARRMLDRVCGYMGVYPESVEMSLYEDSNPTCSEEGWRHGTA